MTIFEWKKLKRGDMVWVHPEYFAFSFVGVIKYKKGKKSVWVNLFGDAQFVWRPVSMSEMLSCLTLFEPGVMATDTFARLRDCRSCANCRSRVLHVHDDVRWCTRKLLRPVNSDICMYWRQAKRKSPNKSTATHEGC